MDKNVHNILKCLVIILSICFTANLAVALATGNTEQTALRSDRMIQFSSSLIGMT